MAVVNREYVVDEYTLQYEGATLIVIITYGMSLISCSSPCEGSV